MSPGSMPEYGVSTTRETNVTLTPGSGSHAEALQHGDMAVTAAEEDEIFEDRQRTCK